MIIVARRIHDDIISTFIENSKKKSVKFILTLFIVYYVSFLANDLLLNTNVGR